MALDKFTEQSNRLAGTELELSLSGWLGSGDLKRRSVELLDGGGLGFVLGHVKVVLLSRDKADGYGSFELSAEDVGFAFESCGLLAALEAEYHRRDEAEAGARSVPRSDPATFASLADLGKELRRYMENSPALLAYVEACLAFRRYSGLDVGAVDPADLV